MVKKYVFGSPFETEAVTEELAAVAYAGQADGGLLNDRGDSGSGV